MNMLTEKEITTVQNIIIDQLEIKPDQVTPDARLKEDLAADSLDQVEIAMKIDEDFGVSLPDEALERVSNVGDLYDVLSSSLGRVSK